MQIDGITRLSPLRRATITVGADIRLQPPFGDAQNRSDSAKSEYVEFINSTNAEEISSLPVDVFHNIYTFYNFLQNLHVGECTVG